MVAAVAADVDDAAVAVGPRSAAPASACSVAVAVAAVAVARLASTRNGVAADGDAASRGRGRPCWVDYRTGRDCARWS